MLKPNCRVSLKKEDVDFISRCVGMKPGDVKGIMRLLDDEEHGQDIIDTLLDKEEVVDRMFEDPHSNNQEIFTESPAFFFYVSTRTVFKSIGITSKTAADYVASVLLEFRKHKRMYRVSDGDDREYMYLADLVEAANKEEPFKRYLTITHLGHYSLFISGFFPESIERRTQPEHWRNSPGLRYYEALGSSAFWLASQHRLAKQADLTETLALLSNQFQLARLALNDLSQNYFEMERA